MSQDAPFERMLSVSRNAFNSGKTRPLAFRMGNLRRFIQMMEESSEEIIRANSLDLRKHKMETILYEIEGITHEAKVAMSNLKSWAAPEELPFNALAVLDKGRIEKVPFGVVLILGAWNYPFLLSLQPMIGALAAGNCVILKPSEVAPNSAKLMAQLIPRYLDPECYHCIEATPAETQLLLQNKFDYIFYTGSTRVGRLVMQAAANHVTPVTLEMGGKTPVYIDDSADVEIACKRTLWGRFVNAGQTCIAPDYILCSKKVESALVQMAPGILKGWYEGDAQKSSSYGRVINQQHCLRLKEMLEGTRGKIVVGGRVDVEDLYVEPTIVIDVPHDDPLMQEEIFGPIIPIFSVNSVTEAIAVINSKSRPLAIYAFSKVQRVNKELQDKTLSGGVCLNDVIWHCVWNGLPFGGIGESGMGGYHGKVSFDTFTHRRSVLDRSMSRLSEKLGEARYCPYNDNKMGQLKLIIRHFLKFNIRFTPIISHLIALCIGAVIVAICLRA